jgi:hypothetical protein
MKPGTNLKALILSLFLLLGFAIKSLYAQTDTTMRADKTEVVYTYVDIYTGLPIDIYYDPTRYVTINRTTNLPVDYYVINSADTVHGMSGLVVNGMLLKEKDGKYKLDNGKVKFDGDELKLKDAAGRKVKWDKGKMQIKEWKSKDKAGHKGVADQWNRVKWKNGEWVIEPVM